MRSLLVILLCCGTHIVFAQEKVNALTTPTSPAASILGMQPGTVLAPKSFKALEAAVFSNFSNEEDGATIPDDFGLEFTPYWFKDHGMSLKDYLYPKISDELLHNLSFSIASTQNFLLQDDTKTKSLAAGIRTSVFFGGKKDYEKVQGFLKTLDIVQIVRGDVREKFDEVKVGILNGNGSSTVFTKALKERLVKSIMVNTGKTEKESTKMVDEISKAGESIVYGVNDDAADRDAFLGSFLDIVRAKIEEKINSFDLFKEYIKAREGFTADIAYACFMNFPHNDFEISYVPRQSFWLTPSYRFKGTTTTIKALGVLRYQWYYTDYFNKYFPDAIVFDNNFDYGLALDATFEKFSVQFEGTLRKSKAYKLAGQDGEGNNLYLRKNDSDAQYIGKLAYQLTPKIVLSYQFGSSFEPVFNGTDTLISLLALNFGFGGPDVGTK